MFYIFFVCLPGITQPGCLRRLKSKVRGRGGETPQSANPPGPRLAIAKFWYCLQCLQLSYSVLHCYLSLALDTRLFNVDKV
jgi:hypothetical protein